MEEVAQSLTMFVYMMVGCFLGPADKAEFRMDIIEETGYVDTVIVKRTATGFELFDSTDGQLKKCATVSYDTAQKSVMVADDLKGKIERLETGPLAEGMKGLKDDRPVLVTVSGAKLKLSKSSEVLFVDLAGKRKTLVIH